MILPTITTGYDNIFTGTWTIGGVATPISLTATVKAIIISMDRQTTYTSVITQPNNNPGADWANGIIGFKFLATDLASISLTKDIPAKIEVQVYDTYKKPGRFDILLEKGNIPI